MDETQWINKRKSISIFFLYAKMRNVFFLLPVIFVHSLYLFAKKKSIFRIQSVDFDNNALYAFEMENNIHC